MESLHDDCLREIFRKLDLVSLAQVRRVNSSFCQLLCDPLFLSELRLSREDSEQSVPLLSAEKYVRLFQSSYPSNVLRLHFKTPQEVMRFIRHSREQEYRQVILDFSELPSLQFLSWLDLQPLATWKHLEELTLLISLNSPLQTENLLDASTHAWLLNLLKSLDAKSSALKSLKIFEVIRTYSRFQTHSYYLRGNIPFEVLAEVSKFNRLSQFMKFSKVLGPPPAGYRLPIDESQSTFELGMGTLVSINPSDSPSSHPGQLRPQSW
ncbi:MAG: F-box protein, partial [Bdellovibrionia bacterium]